MNATTFRYYDWANIKTRGRALKQTRDILIRGWLSGTTGSASDQQSEGCGFEAY